MQCEFYNIFKVAFSETGICVIVMITKHQEVRSL